MSRPEIISYDEPKRIYVPREEEVLPLTDSYATSLGLKPQVQDSGVNEYNVHSYVPIRELIFGQSKQLNFERFQLQNTNFTSIVDMDNEAFENYVQDDIVGRFIEGNLFKFFMLFVIILNSIMIGLETNASLQQNYQNVFDIFDAVFLTVFSLEIAMKWYVGFSAFWFSGWNVFDFILVVIAFAGESLTFLGSSRILRMLRVLRAFRTLRSVSVLEGLLVVVQTIFESIPDMANIILLLLMVMFIFSVVGVNLLGAVDPVHFGSLEKSKFCFTFALFTLFITLTQDGWVDIFEGLQDSGQYVAGSLFFGSFIIIGPFIFINTIVAIIVANLKRKQQENRKLNVSESKSAETHAKPVPVVNAPGKDAFKNQLPLITPPFNLISKEKLTSYLTVLSILEENLKEYTDLKKKLAGIVQDVKQLNVNFDKYAQEFDDSDIDDIEETDEEAETGTGDALTMLLQQRARTRAGNTRGSLL